MPTLLLCGPGNTFLLQSNKGITGRVTSTKMPCRSSFLQNPAPGKLWVFQNASFLERDSASGSGATSPGLLYRAAANLRVEAVQEEWDRVYQPLVDAGFAKM